MPPHISHILTHKHKTDAVIGTHSAATHTATTTYANATALLLAPTLAACCCLMLTCTLSGAGATAARRSVCAGVDTVQPTPLYRCYSQQQMHAISRSPVDEAPQLLDLALQRPCRSVQVKAQAALGSILQEGTAVLCGRREQQAAPTRQQASKREGNSMRCVHKVCFCARFAARHDPGRVMTLCVPSRSLSSRASKYLTTSQPLPTQTHSTYKPTSPQRTASASFSSGYHTPGFVCPLSTA